MARRDKAPQEPAADESAMDTSGPALADGHDQIIEEAPGIGRTTDMSSPMGDPGDLSAFGRSAGLPDDIGLGDDGFGGPVDAGADLGSTLLDDLAGDLSDPGVDGMSDGAGQPAFDDQTGWTMDGNPSGDTTSGEDAPLDHFGNPMMPAPSSLTGEREGQPTPADYDDNLPVDHWGMPPHTASQTEPPSDDDDDDDDDGERQGGGGSGDAPGSQSTPAPDDGTGGDPDAGDFIGGRGDVDPPPEAQDHGGGELISGRGDVDPAPETEDTGGSGGLDMEAAGLGAIDPLKGESTLLGGDTGDLAEMTAAADLNGEPFEMEFDDSLTDADIGGEEA